MTFALVTTLLVTQGGLLSEAVPRAGLLVQAQVEAAPMPRLEDLTNAQLEAEKVRINATAPSALWGNLLIMGGATVFSVGVGIFLFASMVVGGIVMGLAAPIVIAGVVVLLMTGPARLDAAKRVKAIDKERALREYRLREDVKPLEPQQVPPPGV